MARQRGIEKRSFLSQRYLQSYMQRIGDDLVYTVPYYGSELYHHGVKGMKWGIRRNRKSSSSKKQQISEHLSSSVKKGISFVKKHKKQIAIAGVALGLGIAGYALVDSVGAAAIFGGVRRGSREALIKALRSDPDISESLTSQQARDFVNT